MERILYRKGYRYQLAETYAVQTPVATGRVASTPYLQLGERGALVIWEGYAWDGPSGPAVDSPDFMRASLVHDALYQLMRLGEIPRAWRKVADQTMRRICRADGMSAIRAWWCYAGVRLFASGAAMPSSEPRVRVAP